VNLLGLLLQVSVSGRVLAALGAGGATALLPAVTLTGVVLLYLRPGVATLQWFQVVRRGVDYAIARPGREVFCTVLGRDEMLRSKGLIDTAVYRAGDAAGAWAYGALAAMPGLGPAAPLAVIPISLGWIVLSLALGRAMARRLAEGRAPGPPEPEASPLGPP
jgi:AAA family ATP:ADP antiporter